MITKEQITTLVEEYLKDTDYALQTLEIDKDNNILVEIDRLGVVDVDFCAELNQYIVESLKSKVESGEIKDVDYSLEVGSVSLTAPFVSKIQYQKHLGHEVEVLVKNTDRSADRTQTASLTDNSQAVKYRGMLVSVDERTFAIDVEVMVAVEGKKKKQKQIQTKEFAYNDVIYTKYNLKI